MGKHDTKFKLKIVRQLLAGPDGARRLAQRHGIAYSVVYRWANSYREHGEAGLSVVPVRYDRAFRLKVLRHMWRKGLSYTQTAAVFGIAGLSTISRWERAYHAGDGGALAPRPGPRAPMAKPKKPPFTPSSGPDEARPQKDLIRELEYLRAENAYLKKLDALIQSKKEAASKKRG